jgi:hypothetical protein
MADWVKQAAAEAGRSRVTGAIDERICGTFQIPQFQRHGMPESCRLNVGLGRSERTDGDVISVRISERELHSSSVWIHMWLFFQPAD